MKGIPETQTVAPSQRKALLMDCMSPPSAVDLNELCKEFTDWQKVSFQEVEGLF